MFYSVQILSKGGPLQVIWLAAHMDRQLKRQQVFETNIPFSVDAIIKPQGAPGNEAPLALRLTGQLLLGVVKVYARKVAYLAEDCDNTLQKIGTVERSHQDHTDATAGVAASSDQAQPDKRGKRAAAKSTASMHGLQANEDMWPASDEEIFVTPASKAQQAGATPGGRPGLLPSLSMRQADSVLTARTPMGGSRLLADAETPMAARTLSFAATLPHPLDLEEMFEPVPEHFEFDLDEFEMDALTQTGAVPFSSQQISNLQSTLPLVSVPEEFEDAEPAEQDAAPVADAERMDTDAAPRKASPKAHRAASQVAAPSSGQPATHHQEQDTFMFEPDMLSQDQQATLCYPSSPQPTGQPAGGSVARTGADAPVEDGEEDAGTAMAAAHGEGEAGTAALAEDGDQAAGAETAGAAGGQQGAASQQPGTERRLTRAQVAAAAKAALGADAVVGSAPVTPASAPNKRSAQAAGLPDPGPAATGRVPRRAAAVAASAATAAAAAATAGSAGKARAARRASQSQSPPPAADQASGQSSGQQVQPQRTKLSLTYTKTALDIAGTTLSNSEYRAYLADRTPLIRQGGEARRGGAPASSRAVRRDAAHVLQGAAQPEVRLLFALPSWTHPVLQGLYAQALGIKVKGSASVDVASLLSKHQVSLRAGPLAGLVSFGALEREGDDEDVVGDRGDNAPLPDEQRGTASEVQGSGVEGGEGQVGQQVEGQTDAGVEDGAQDLANVEAMAGDHSMADVGAMDEGVDLPVEEGMEEGVEEGRTLAEQAEELDLYQGGSVDVFEESRRVPEEESEEGDGGEGQGAGGRAPQTDAQEAGLTSRTKALLRQVELAIKQQGQHAAKRQRLDVAPEEGVGSNNPEAGESSASEAHVLLSQLLPEDRSSMRRAASSTQAPRMRHRAAQAFYDLLVLQNRGLVRLQQATPYQDLVVGLRVLGEGAVPAGSAMLA